MWQSTCGRREIPARNRPTEIRECIPEALSGQVQPRRGEWHHHQRPDASRDDCRIAITPFMAEQAKTVARFIEDISSNFATVANVLSNL
jgi:hypothetical protein